MCFDGWFAGAGDRCVRGGTRARARAGARAPRAGVAVIRGAQVKKTRVKLKKAGWTRVKVKPSRKLSNRLKLRKSARTRVTVRYLTNDGCQPALTRARVTFRAEPNERSQVR